MNASPQSPSSPIAGDGGRRRGALHARRILNSNAVMVVDNADAVSIVLGKAIGYGVRPGDLIDDRLITETFLPDAQTPIEQLAAFVAETPIQFVKVAREIVDAADERVELRVSQSLLLSLADHIFSAIERAEQDVIFQYPLRWEVMQLYPREVAVGRLGVQIIHERLGIVLPDEEAVPLAMHIVNAQFSSQGLSPTIEMTRRISGVLNTVEEVLGVSLDRNTMNVARFVTHLRYLFFRMEHGEFLDSGSQEMVDAVARARPGAYRCAQSVRSLFERDGSRLTEEEILYLTLHIARLTDAAGSLPVGNAAARPPLGNVEGEHQLGSPADEVTCSAHNAPMRDEEDHAHHIP